MGKTPSTATPAISASATLKFGEGYVFVDADDIQGGFGGDGVEVVELVRC